MKKSEKIKHGLILAAGFGTRLRPITNTIPKCLVKVNGKEMLGHTIDHIEAKIENIHINTHYLSDQVADFIAKHPMHKKLHASYEAELLGTGGTIKNIANQHDIHTLLVHNSDAYFYGDQFLDDFITSYNGQELYIALYPKALLKFEEKGDFDVESGRALYNKGADYVYTGLAIIKTKRFCDNKSGNFTLTEIMKTSKDIGAYILPEQARWIDIGTIEKLKSL